MPVEMPWRTNPVECWLPPRKWHLQVNRSTHRCQQKQQSGSKPTCSRPHGTRDQHGWLEFVLRFAGHTSASAPICGSDRVSTAGCPLLLRPGGLKIWFLAVPIPFASNGISPAKSPSRFDIVSRCLSHLLCMPRNRPFTMSLARSTQN